MNRYWLSRGVSLSVRMSLCPFGLAIVFTRPWSLSVLVGVVLFELEVD